VNYTSNVTEIEDKQSTQLNKKETLEFPVCLRIHK